MVLLLIYINHKALIWILCTAKQLELRDILDEKFIESALDLRVERRFIFQQENDPQHTANTLKDNCECP